MSEVRLIDANALKEDLRQYFSDGTLDTVSAKLAFNMILRKIDEAPTVDKGYDFGYADGHGEGYELGKNSRPQGEWIDEGQYAEGHSEHAYFCKNCDYHIIEKPNMISENRFCKNCGAEMRGNNK